MNIENNIPLPQESKKRTRKAIAEKQKHPAQSLIDALKFIKPAISKETEYCMIAGGWVAAQNKNVTIAHPIQEDLQAFPHIKSFLEALQKCENEFSITQLSQRELCVKSGEFKAIVDCASNVRIDSPNPNIFNISSNRSILNSIKNVLPVVPTSNIEDVHSYLFLKENTTAGTNKAAIIESWHGVSLPKMLLSKECAAVLSKCNINLIGFGYSPVKSATFYFENGAFITVKIESAFDYPNYEILFKSKLNLQPVALNFFDAVKTIEFFSKTGTIFFRNGNIQSEQDYAKASTFGVENLPDGMCFDAKNLKLVKHVFENAEFDIENKKVYFANESSRGILMCTIPKQHFEDDPINS